MCPHCLLPLGSTRCWMNAECFHYCQWQSRKIRNKNLVKYEDPRSNLGDKWSGIECSWKTEAPIVARWLPPEEVSHCVVKTFSQVACGQVHMGRCPPTTGTTWTATLEVGCPASGKPSGRAFHPVY